MERYGILRTSGAGSLVSAQLSAIGKRSCGPRELGVALEIDSQPDRLDLDDVWARRARDIGVVLAIDSDAHAASQLSLMRYRVATARRGWAEKTNVLNTLPLDQMLGRLRGRRPLS
jgi:DNA polymerase (family 10)